MPKVNKLRRPSTKTDTKQDAGFICCRCGKHYSKQKGNFSAAQSPIYKRSGGYLPACITCMDELCEQYKLTLGSTKEAIRRLCMKFDVYWHVDIYEMVSRSGDVVPTMRTYMSKINLVRYIGKTYDNTISEEQEVEQLRLQRIISSAVADAVEEVNDTQKEAISEVLDPLEDQASQQTIPAEFTVNQDIIDFWGSGFDTAFYKELDRKYRYWTKDRKDGVDIAEAAIYKQICMLEVVINKETAAGKPTEKLVNSLNNLLGSLNLKPSQNKENDDDNYIPFGLEIRKWEDEEPVVELDEKFKDVDGIRRNVLAWMLGPICKLVGIKNIYSEIYEAELSEYTVERPSDDEEDDENSAIDALLEDSLTDEEG